jgi:hypothetical protein
MTRRRLYFAGTPTMAEEIFINAAQLQFTKNKNPNYS